MWRSAYQPIKSKVNFCCVFALRQRGFLERLICRSSHHLYMERLIGRSTYLILEGQICLLLCKVSNKLQEWQRVETVETTVQYIVFECCEVHYRDLECSVLSCKVQCSSMYYSAVQCSWPFWKLHPCPVQPGGIGPVIELRWHSHRGLSQVHITYLYGNIATIWEEKA